MSVTIKDLLESQIEYCVNPVLRDRYRFYLASLIDDLGSDDIKIDIILLIQKLFCYIDKFRNCVQRTLELEDEEYINSKLIRLGIKPPDEPSILKRAVGRRNIFI